MYRILHCADLHLEACFASGGTPASVGSRRRTGLWATLERILALAQEHGVAAVTIAGDLYEQDYATPETADALRRRFAAVAPIQVIISPGESDPYTDGSLYALTRWPENVSIFPPGPLSSLALAPNIHLWGAAYPPEPGQAIQTGLRAGHPGVNLLLLHADWSEQRGALGEGLFCVDGPSLRAAGIDLALLGHRHDGRTWREGNVQCIYPGSSEPLSPDEAGGDHQAVLLSLGEGVPEMRGFPLSRWRYLDVRVDLSGCASPEEASALVGVSLRNQPGGVDECTLCRVTLIGTPRFDIDLEALRSEVSTPGSVQYATEMEPAYEPQQYADEPTVRGLLVRRFLGRLDAAADDDERTAAAAALGLALRALDGKKVRPDETG